MLIESQNEGAVYLNPQRVLMISITKDTPGLSDLNVWFDNDDTPMVFQNEHDIITKYAQKLDRYFNESN